MNDLVFLQKNQALTTSLRVAEYFEKPHKNILAKIESLNAEIQSAKILADYSPLFFKSSYEDERGRKQIMYLLNRDAFMEVVGNLNGAKARKFKREYYAEFNRMEKKLQELNDPIRIATRYQGKLTRLKETDVIKQLVAYAETQGSKNSDKLYLVYTRLANKVVGLKEIYQDSKIRLDAFLEITFGEQRLIA